MSGISRAMTWHQMADDGSNTHPPRKDAPPAGADGSPLRRSRATGRVPAAPPAGPPSTPSRSIPLRRLPGGVPSGLIVVHVLGCLAALALGASIGLNGVLTTFVVLAMLHVHIVEWSNDGVEPKSAGDSARRAPTDPSPSSRGQPVSRGHGAWTIWECGSRVCAPPRGRFHAPKTPRSRRSGIA
jgi:hypothetical protein